MGIALFAGRVASQCLRVQPWEQQQKLNEQDTGWFDNEK